MDDSFAGVGINSGIGSGTGSFAEGGRDSIGPSLVAGSRAGNCMAGASAPTSENR